jgi:hypothetical protein
MVNTSFQFYKDNISYGYPVKVKGKWDSSNQAETKAEPQTGYVLFVREISFVMTQDLAFSGASAYMRIQHSSATGSNEYTCLDIDEAQEILAACEGAVREVAIPSGTTNIHGKIEFDPPVKCLESESEYFTVIEEATLTVVGTIWFTISGWQFTETEYNEVA